MSEISILSNQYKRLVDTSDKVNNSVIVYKKCNLLNEAGIRQKHPGLSITPADVQAAKEILIRFLSNLKALLEAGSTESDFIPSAVMEDYKSKLDAKPYFRENLSTALEQLTSNGKVNARVIATLDEIISLLDSERSMLFRKLRTARG
jgi:hypothetical protein